MTQTQNMPDTGAVQVVRGFWDGPPLSPYEHLSLRSFVGRGHKVLLYSYDRDLQVPDGVELVDADEIVPGPVREFVHENGERTPALHSDVFRYEVLRCFGGWYFDLDVIMVGDRLPPAQIYLGRQDDGFVNGAIMRFPANAPAIMAAHQAVPTLLGNAKWGAIGPALLTNLVEKFGLVGQVRPWQAAYPIRPTEVVQMFLPRYRDELEERLASADFLHLWNEIWRRVRIPKIYGPPRGSFLDALFGRFGFEFSAGARMSAGAVESWFQEFALMEQVRRMHARDVSASELAQALFERDMMATSTSWRMTAPLRGLVNALRRAAAVHARPLKRRSISRSLAPPAQCAGQGAWRQRQRL